MKRYEAKEREALPVVNRFQQQLRALHADLERNPPHAETPCDASSLNRAFGAAVTPHPLFADEGFVATMLTPKHNWRWSEDELFATPEFGFGTDSAVSLAETLQKSETRDGSVFIVFVVTEDRRPTMIGGDPATWNAAAIPQSAFFPGVLNAWAVVYDLAPHRRLCQVQVKATSSETVPYHTGRPSNALFLDYSRRVHAAAADALSRADRRLTPYFVDPAL